MFTGLVQHLAPVVHVAPTPTGARLALELGPLAEAAEYGDSISINGACLTVASKVGSVCGFDAVRETLARTTLGLLRPGSAANIEPSLRVGDKLGGHFVLGHVDGTGTLASIKPTGDGAEVAINAERSLTQQMVPKGSVAIDGVSLTLVDVGDRRFTCAIIPTTLCETTLGSKSPGDAVNIETDILGKFVQRYLGTPADSGLTFEKLREAGFAG
jgi:riboflavin synthase